MTTLNQGESTSIWTTKEDSLKFPILNEDINVDVCIVGGGLAGLTTAYILSKKGQRVCVLEGFDIAAEQTGRSTAQFTTVLDQRYFTLEILHGLEGARLAAESHHAAIKEVEAIIRHEKIECNLEKINGYLFNSNEVHNYTLKSNHELSDKYLKKELEAAHRAGLHDVYMTDKIPLETFGPGPALCFPNQLQLNPIKYVNGLAEIILKKGGHIYTNSHVIEVKGGKSAFAQVENGHYVRCKSIVVTTNTPINDLLAIHTKQASYTTYVLGFEFPKQTIENALYWDTQDPYHYVRLVQKDLQLYDILLVGGEDHRTGQNSDPGNCYTRLENWARKKFPSSGRLIYHWSGQVINSVDGLAYIGHNPMDSENVFVATGQSGNGMTYSTITGMLLSDLITGRKNHWEILYKPSRINYLSTGNFLKENINTIIQYKDWIVEQQSSNLDEIPPNEGIVYRDGMRLIAAYKDKYGNLELHSAICPHLRGVVHWNTLEKSWDCPCHGSRFNCNGKVMDGPAISDLKMISSIPAQPYPEDVELKSQHQDVVRTDYTTEQNIY